MSKKFEGFSDSISCPISFSLSYFHSKDELKLIGHPEKHYDTSTINDNTFN